MSDYLLRLAPNNPNGVAWFPLVSLRTNQPRTILATRILAVDPTVGNVPGVRVHVRLAGSHLLVAGETVVGIADGAAVGAGIAMLGLNGFWPVLQMTRL